MSCIRIIMVAAGVSFVIVLPIFWFNFPGIIENHGTLVLSALTASISAIAAIASSCAADAANSISKQIEESDKIRRTIDMSPYNSDRFIEAWEYLQQELKEVREYKKSKFVPIPWKECDGLFQIDHENRLKLKRNFLIVLNFWGRIATAHEQGVLDNDIAKRMYKYGFVRFINLSKNYLGTGTNKPIYADTWNLYKDWKKSPHPGPPHEGGGGRKE